jgi:protein SCO1/2
VGPDLLNVTQLRDRAWLARYVARPDLVLAQGDPIAKQLFARYKSVRMPNLRLTTEDVDALLPYIEQLSRAAMSPATQTQ